MVAVSNLETRLDNTDRFVEVLRPPARPQPDPDPSYNQPHYSGAAMDTHLSGGYCQQPHYLNPNIDGQPLYPCYQPDEYEQRADNQLFVPQHPPYTGFDSRRVGGISAPPLPEPLPHPTTVPPYDLPCPPPPIHLPPPQPDLEPNVSVAALVSQLDRLTADVEQLVSRMDAKEYCLSDPHVATRPPPAPVSCHLPQPTDAAPAVLHHVPPPEPAPLYELPLFGSRETLPLGQQHYTDQEMSIPSLTPQQDDPYSHFQPSEELYPPVYNGE